MAISFHLVHVKLLEEGIRTWFLEESFAASVSKCVLRNISGKKLLVALPGSSQPQWRRETMDISSLIPPNKADLTEFLAEASFTCSCLSTVNLFKAKPIFS